MTDTIQTDNLFAEYLPDGEISEEDVDGAYRTAVKDVHPDTGGSAEEFRRVNEAAKKLRDEMGSSSSDSFRIEEELEDETTDYSSERENTSSSISLPKCWSEGLEQINEAIDSNYEMVQYDSISENEVVGVFEDDSDLSFAIEAEMKGSLFEYETTYFTDSEGEIGNFSKNKVIFDSEKAEKYLQGVAALSTKRAEAIKQRI